jgi:hypothetical protein
MISNFFFGSVTELVDVSDLKSADYISRGGSSPPTPIRGYRMEYQVRSEYRFVDTVGIVLVYTVNGMEFVYDDISEEELMDPMVQAVASCEPVLSIETITRNSEYLMMEEMHPLLFPIELDSQSVLPPV